MLAAKLNAPILLISPDNWLEAKRFIDESAYTRQIILGGPGVIDENLKTQFVK
ncbi:cell wall-binding repeat-containing protein [Desulfitobacterium sp. AusDCA]